MQGDARIIETLGELLANELAAINTYFVDAKLRDNWGFPELAKHAYDESIAEMKHAETLIERIIYFDSVPNVQKLGRIKVGESVGEQYEVELELERATLGNLVTAIELSREVGDDGTRLAFEPMVEAGEDAIDWLETQLGLIEQLGESVYLSQHLA